MESLVKAYLEERRCLGFSLDIAGSQLTAFARFADGAGHRGPLTMDVIINWIKNMSEVSPMTSARRVEVIRPFAKYCARIDPATDIPAPVSHLPTASAAGTTSPNSSLSSRM